MTAQLCVRAAGCIHATDSRVPTSEMRMRSWGSSFDPSPPDPVLLFSRLGTCCCCCCCCLDPAEPAPMALPVILAKGRGIITLRF